MSLLSKFKLISTNIICEGYWNSDNKWIHKGSYRMEHHLLLIEEMNQVR
jgi:hypothetical protein